MNGKRLGLAIALAVAVLLVLNHWQQQRDASARQAARQAQEQLAQASETRIVYPADALPQLKLPGGQERTVRSLLKVPRQLNHGEFAWDDNGAAGPVWIRVDLERQLISVFRGEDEIGTAVILYGAPEKPTPQGAFRVIAKATDHYSRSYDAPMPFMLRLTDDGVAIHASRVRPDGATHGCLGVPLRFAEKLYGVAGMGTEVYILDKPAPNPGKTA
ncbi:MAG: L,D-transpeptidase [Sphingomonadaceae bacterium]|nr:L,D-transpeptidase [Sphingomonadaceae bacterium]